MATHDLETLLEMARTHAAEAFDSGADAEYEAVGLDEDDIEELTDNAWHYYGVHCFEANDVDYGEHGGKLALAFQAEMGRLIKQRNGGK